MPKRHGLRKSGEELLRNEKRKGFKWRGQKKKGLGEGKLPEVGKEEGKDLAFNV